MKLIPLTLRLTRIVIRYITNLLNYIQLHLALLLNDVQHGSIHSNGVPYIAVSPNSKCFIGNNLTLNNGIRFNPIGYNQPCYLVATNGGVLSIGNNVGMSQAALICHCSITIEDNVKLGGGVKIYDTNFHSLNPIIRRDHYLDMQEKKCSPVVIEHDAFIGAGSFILQGVTIGANSIVGAGSVVTKSIPANEVWAGNPAHFIKKLYV